MSKMIKERKDVDQSLTWDLSAIYSSEEKYNLAMNELLKLASEVEKSYKGKLNNPADMNECLDKIRKASV